MIRQYYADDSVTLFEGDALDVLRTLPDASVDSVVTDPPYGLADHHPRIIEAAMRAWLTGDREHVPDGKGFMGREWDRFVPPPAVWDECWRVLKPGGHLLAFAGARTHDLMSMSIRLAGFEIRDSIKWIYSQGFPKGQDIGKHIDRQRRDRDDVLKVTAWLRAARLAAGLTVKQVDAVFGTNGMASHWMATKSRAALVPTIEQWERLRELLGFGDEMDAEVRRLNDRKGDVGEDFAAREVVGTRHAGLSKGKGSVFLNGTGSGDERGHVPVTVAASKEAKRWEGWNTTLKPAHEPIVVARKSTGFNSTVANVLEHGTGALNIAGCRVGDDERTNQAGGASSLQRVSRVKQGYRHTVTTSVGEASTVTGRWPANVVLAHAPDCEVCECGWRGPLDETGNPHGWTDDCRTGLDCVPGCPVADLDRQSGTLTSGANPTRRSSDKFQTTYGDFKGQRECEPARGANSGGASRFFPVFRYEAKAAPGERLEVGGIAHPTVKPLALMRWLVRLVTPVGGVVLDPFVGSGTTAEACVLEGFRCIAAESHPPFLPLTVARLSKPLQPALDFGDDAA